MTINSTSSSNTMNLTSTAEYIGVDKRTLYNMIKDGRFDVKPIQGTDPRRWNVDDVKAWRERK